MADIIFYLKKIEENMGFVCNTHTHTHTHIHTHTTNHVYKDPKIPQFHERWNTVLHIQAPLVCITQSKNLTGKYKLYCEGQTNACIHHEPIRTATKQSTYTDNHFMTLEEEFYCLSLYITYIEAVQPECRLKGRLIAA